MAHFHKRGNTTQQGGYTQALQNKNYIVVGYGGGRGAAIIFNIELGFVAVIDPDDAKVYLYEYGGGGFGLGAGVIATVQVGIMNMAKPTDIEGWGLDVAGFLAGGNGASMQIQGNGVFSNGNNQTIGGTLGYGAGGGFGISGNITYTFNKDIVNLNALPKNVLKAILAFNSIAEYPYLMQQTEQALSKK